MVTANPTRFRGDGRSKYSFRLHALVACPACGERAQVLNDRVYGPENLRLHCPNCSYRRVGPNVEYEMSLKYSCAGCGVHIKQPAGMATRPPNSPVHVECPACHLPQQTVPSCTATAVTYGEQALHASRDPFYNLPLWLTGEVKGGRFYALNYEHLAQIGAYVAADLRERNLHRVTGMVDRLPKWITSRKNRAAVLREVARMRAR